MWTYQETSRKEESEIKKVFPDHRESQDMASKISQLLPFLCITMKEPLHSSTLPAISWFLCTSDCGAADLSPLNSGNLLLHFYVMDFRKQAGKLGGRIFLYKPHIYWSEQLEC